MTPSQSDRASQIRALLTAESRANAGYQDFQRVMNRYAIERFLYRLGRSRYENHFILKGAMLLAIYIPDAYRTTRDVDFQLFGDYLAEQLKQMLADVCAIDHDDGLTFATSGIQVTSAGVDRQYPGYAARIPVQLGASNCDIQIDISFGDAVIPPARRIKYPSLLRGYLPQPEPRVNPVETVVAQKFEAIVKLGMSNNRLKDYHDLAEIARTCMIEGATLCEAFQATFTRRGTEIPGATPIGLRADFHDAKRKQDAWQAFVKRQGLSKRLVLQEMCRQIETFVMPVAHACANEEVFLHLWRKGVWHKEE